MRLEGGQCLLTVEAQVLIQLARLLTAGRRPCVHCIAPSRWIVNADGMQDSRASRPAQNTRRVLRPVGEPNPWKGSFETVCSKWGRRNTMPDIGGKVVHITSLVGEKRPGC